MTNFERASLRMRSQGFRPFQPDTNTANTARSLPGDTLPPELATDAARMDAFIAVFAMGVVLGWLIGG